MWTKTWWWSWMHFIFSVVILARKCLELIHKMNNNRISCFCYVDVFCFCLQQKISIPRSENSSELQTFSFDLSNVGRDNPQGSFDCIQQYITRWKQAQNHFSFFHSSSFFFLFQTRDHCIVKSRLQVQLIFNECNINPLQIMLR